MSVHSELCVRYYYYLVAINPINTSIVEPTQYQMNTTTTTPTRNRLLPSRSLQHKSLLIRFVFNFFSLQWIVRQTSNNKLI